MPDNGPTPATDDGPTPLPSDPWDFDPDADLPNETYRGVRRSERRRGPRPLVIAILIVLVVAGLAWFALSGGTSPDLVGTGQDSAAPAPLDTTAVPSAAAPTSPSPAPTRTTTRTTPVPTRASTTQPFTTLVYEAEAGMPRVKLRSARVVSRDGASGGKAVEITSDSGEIQFRSISIPMAGTYRFSISYAPDARTVGSLTVGHGTSASVTFLSGSGCCLVATVQLALSPGTYTADLRIPTGTPDGPAIDRMTISRS